MTTFNRSNFFFTSLVEVKCESHSMRHEALWSGRLTDSHMILNDDGQSVFFYFLTVRHCYCLLVSLCVYVCLCLCVYKNLLTLCSFSQSKRIELATAKAEETRHTRPFSVNTQVNIYSLFFFIFFKTTSEK